MSEPVPPPCFQNCVPPGDERERLVCGDCGWIHYVNPKVIVGAVVTSGGKFLLCRRAIEPRAGFWTMPAGFMEEGESAEHGAAREVWEEATARVRLDALLAVYSIPVISQVQLIYRGELTLPGFAPGLESLETRLFGWDEIPWNELAFPSVTWALQHFHAVRDQTAFAPFTAPVLFESRPGR
ncbi:NUDIX hydrolase [Planctellipticum variicoloris]|uniref:NUDIX hydrolase n=1 Tax=Planctellipticum variicoloris TaxID=3064265 RepID=UPI003013D196|nr:NUDIX hydrolase [Planctomycetaceae bacterium SH412]